MIGVIVGSLIVERGLKRHGENGDRIWDALIWVLPIAIIGARLGYVLNATLGGNRYYIENPIQIINIPQGGLHIYGGLVLGATRVEALSDMVFAFALTLLVVSSAPPSSFVDLNEQLWGFPGFAAAFAILLIIWHSHYIFFRRYALEDGWTTTLKP
jgi:hypothetical protein